MFCHSCGGWKQKDHKFCPKCGASGTSGASSTATTPVSSFKSFLCQKSKERQTAFKPKKHKMDELVTISIGIGTTSSGVFKAVRGKSLPLKVSKGASAITLLEEALKKRGSYDRTFRSDKTYKLCFPDGSEIITLPGSKEAFTLEKYKEDLGKTYTRITLFLCPWLDTSDSEPEQSTYWSDQDNDDLLNDIPDTAFEDDNYQPDFTAASSITACSSSGSSTSTTFAGAFQCTSTGTSSSTTEGSFPEDASQHIDVNVILDSDHGAATSSALPIRDVVVHRSNVLKEMIEEFKYSDILSYQLNLVVINERGEIEDGRGVGVVREVITMFWHQFFTSLSTGATEKVPSVRHDYQRQEWEAIGKILLYGYSRIQYFPVTLSGVFIGCCLFDESAISEDFILEAFDLYIAKDEADVLKKCKEGELEPNDEDVLEVLSSYKCYKNPTRENIVLIISQLAHQELIQKPKYISNCWKPTISSLKSYPQLKSLDCMKELYEAKKPTVRKVIKLLIACPENDSERNSFDHLKRYIKSLDEISLKVFLQFTTGSDVITVTGITVTFNTIDGAGRSPVARTCGPVLELPSTYQSYNELAEEFGFIMASKEAWGFTIV